MEEETPQEAEESFAEILAESLKEQGADPVPLDVRDIPLDQIGETENTRPVYSGIEGLAETMHLQGQLQPCVVRPSPEGAAHGKPFELVFGFRRRRAAEFLREQGLQRWDSLRCEVRDIPDEKRLRQTIVENYQRENLMPGAEARAMLQLKQSSDPPLSNAEIARELGCDPSHVSHRLSLLKLEMPKKVEVLPVDEADAESDENGGSDEEKKPAPKAKKPVDIIEMIDKGEISASTAEVIASLPDRKQQEKLAVLTKRGGWSTKKAAKWAREVKENKADEGGPELGPVEMVQIEDVVSLPSLRPREDLSAAEIDQIVLYILLRNGMDREMLDYLDEEHGVPYESLWDYVAALGEADVTELTGRLARRYIASAHRWFSLESSLKEALGQPEDETSIEEIEAAEEIAREQSESESAGE